MEPTDRLSSKTPQKPYPPQEINIEHTTPQSPKPQTVTHQQKNSQRTAYTKSIHKKNTCTHTLFLTPCVALLLLCVALSLDIKPNNINNNINDNSNNVTLNTTTKPQQQQQPIYI
jgi:hypothetical protein